MTYSNNYDVIDIFCGVFLLVYFGPYRTRGFVKKRKYGPLRNLVARAGKFKTPLFTFVDRLDPFRAAVVENFDGLRVFGRVPGLEGDVVQGPEVGGQSQIQFTLHPTRVALHSPEEFLDVFHLNIGAKI